MQFRKSLVSATLSLFGVVGVSSLQAATITPNILDDPPLPGVNVGTDCSLRMAMQSINNGDPNFEGGCGAVATGTLGTSDEIVLGAGTYVLTIANADDDNASGDLVAFNDFILTGQGVDATTIDASGIPGGDRIIEIQDINAAAISGITFTGGSLLDDSGGAIFSLAALLELDDVRLTDNQANNGGGLLVGGGATLISNSTIDGNQAVDCGGLLLSNSSVGVSYSTISGNDALDGQGGGICSAGSLFLTNSTISGNTAVEEGGGLILAFSGASSGLKGAYNVTITLNDSGSSGGGIAGIVFAQGGGDPFPIRIFNSIIAGNTATASGNDCANGNFPSGGFNLIGQIGPNDNCTDFVDGVNGDQVGTDTAPIDPLLDPLSDNGGPTQTHALLVGSPAIDRGNPDGCEAVDVANFLDSGVPAFNDLTDDQRGEIRPVAVLDPSVAICDIGAYEFQVVPPTPTPTPVVTPTPPPFQGFVEGSGCSLNPASVAAASGSLWLGLGLMAGFLGLRKNSQD